MRGRLAFLIFGVLLLLRAGTASRIPVVIEPATFVSEDGHWTLSVDPSERSAAGPANYRMQHDGQIVWEGERPWTLLRPTVLSDGRVVGHAYTHGADGYARHLGTGNGDTVIAVLDSDGTTRLDDRLPRRFNPILHSDPTPLVFKMELDEERKLLMVWLGSQFFHEESEVRLYDLETGELKRDVTLRPLGQKSEPQQVHLFEVRLLPESPLLLVRWRDGYFNQRAMQWSFLSMEDGLPVYTIGVDDFEPEGSIIDSRAVALSLYKDGSNVRNVRVLLDGAKVRVWDLGVVPVADVPAPTPSTTTQSTSEETGLEVTLAPVTPVQFWGSQETGEQIDDLRFDRFGRLLLLVRDDSNSSTTLRILAKNGAMISERALPLPRGGYWLHPGPDSDQIMLWSRQRFDPDGVVHTYSMQTETMKSQHLGEFAILDVAALDEGFVVLADKRGKYNSVESLVRYRPGGSEVWRVDKDWKQGENKLFSPEGLAVSATGEIAVIDNVRKALQFFAGDGGYLRTIDLTAAWGRRPNYPTDVYTAGDGWLVRDFNGAAPWVWTSDDGTFHRDTSPTFSDGEPFDGIVRIAPDGTTWGASGSRLMKLDDSGKAVETFGPEIPSDRPDSIGELFAAPDGNVYALDGRSKVVFVYTFDGAFLRKLIPEPGDFSFRDRDQILSADRDGNVWISNDSGSERKGGLLFDATGKRIGWHQIPEATLGKWYARPGGAWVQGFGELYAVDFDGNVEATITRRPDNKWISKVSRIAIAPDGAIAVLDRMKDGTVSFYDRNANPLGQVSLGEDRYYRLAHRGDIVIVGSGERGYTGDGKPLWIATPSDGDRDGEPLLPVGRNELWLWKTGSFEVGAVVLPEPSLP